MDYNYLKYKKILIVDDEADLLEMVTSILEQDGIKVSGASDSDLSAEGVIYRMAQAVLDGNSHFYITLEGQELIFDIPVTEFPEIVGYDTGDQISLRYEEGESICTVTQLEGREPEAEQAQTEEETSGEE